MLDRLEFVLPDFTRFSWVSDRAQVVWEPRLRRISHAWKQVEWRSVAAGARRSMLTRLSHDENLAQAERWAQFDLVSTVLGIEGQSNGAYSSHPHPVRLGEDVVERVVVGRPADVDTFRHAWRNSDHDTVGKLLGYPACCRAFFESTWIKRRFVDTTWAMATLGDTAGPTVDVAGPPAANILWRWMGVRAVPHLPCSFACDETVEFGDQLRKVGEKLGYIEEFEWINEILSWPVEWSALHGIAEIKTPILKVATRTDATARKYVVRRNGSRFPVEGADGLAFPYRPPRRLSISSTASFRHGMDNPAPEQVVRPDWYHKDNGFYSRHTMTRLHAPIVAMAHASLPEKRGNIIDFGCGNGALLETLCQKHARLIPFGIDINPHAIAHAKQTHAQYADNFLKGDFFRSHLLDRDTPTRAWYFDGRAAP